MIRAVTLDFWNTLMDDFHVPDRETVRAVKLAKLVAPYGYRLDPVQIAAGFDDVWQHFDKIWYKKKRTPTTAESAGVLLHALRIKLPGEAVARVVAMLEEVVLECPPHTVAEVPETLPLLAERYALAVV
jgi:FMN phosphatase YigB (HAD superfamily)